jgi:hypothetical protein
MDTPNDYMQRIAHIMGADQDGVIQRRYAFDSPDEAVAALQEIDGQVSELQALERTVTQGMQAINAQYKQRIAEIKPGILGGLFGSGKNQRSKLQWALQDKQSQYGQVLATIREMQEKLDQVGSSIQNYIEHPERFEDEEDRVDRARLLLLSKFLKPRTLQSITESKWSSSWRESLGEPVTETLDTFLREGLIAMGGIRAKMAQKFRVVDLKEMLRARDLKVSGRKAELIDRLVNHAPSDMQRETMDVETFTCTDRGRQRAEVFVKEEKERRSHAEMEALAALRERNFRRAVDVVVTFEAQQIFPRGIGIDWQNYNTERDLAQLHMIFSESPAILAPLTKAQINKLRPIAGMLHLWGKSRAPVAWWPSMLKEDIESSDLHFDAEVAARMIMFHANHKRQLRSYKDAGIDRAAIMATADSCKACKEMNGTSFLIDEAPELPNPNCTSPMGCRCTIVAQMTGFP